MNNVDSLIQHTNALKPKVEALTKEEAINEITKHVEVVDFQTEAGLSDEDKLKYKHYFITAVEELQEVIEREDLGICRNADQFFVYNRCMWYSLDQDEIKAVLRKAAVKMGVGRFIAKDPDFVSKYFKTFLNESYLKKPLYNPEIVMINFKNGTLDLDVVERTIDFRDFHREDFLTYQLPFEYNTKAECPMFMKFLDEVLPEKEAQMLLAEYIGYIFIRHDAEILKLEKALMCYGSGANGKSVLFEIVSRLLGRDNITNYSIEELTDEKGYNRAVIANKLLNYGSEITKKMNVDLFKRIVSGEAVPARLPYGKPMTLYAFAKMMWNANTLPTDVETTEAFFRRFIILPFNVTIPVEKRDPDLHIKISRVELSGIFNWVIEGLNRLLDNKRFTVSPSSKSS